MENSISYLNNKKITAQEMSILFQSSGIHRPIDDMKRLSAMIENASIIWTAWDDDKLVGVARALTDFSYACYLSDLAVDINYQKQGIGKTLINKIHGQIGPDVSLLLLSAPSAMSYYPKIQFENVDNAFLIKRKPF
ncbi:GNAT family N-acetyltransferase [Leuconostoc falkenbergense]|uniref:GNAT family N-acetyltransferase n=1 Tax=Leuconostoc falkenbergense TaxID=2766470 RepID=UPI0021AAB1BC|nr:GNAT family N-acetyltransferase [Leuconostoc falkenbergense]MCT4378076.1 GNAT family N-acetyltransferase [Leuconostoc falkenbergense]